MQALDLNFYLLKYNLPKCIDMLMHRGLCPNGKIGDYYTSEAVVEAIVYLLAKDDVLGQDVYASLIFNHDNDNIKLAKSRTKIQQFFNNKMYMYNIYIQGCGKEDEGELSDKNITTTIDHCFVIICINHQWKMIDTLIPFRKLTMRDINIDDLIIFVDDNEKNFSLSSYNNFFGITLESNNIANIEYLDFVITRTEWSSDNITERIIDLYTQH